MPEEIKHKNRNSKKRLTFGGGGEVSGNVAPHIDGGVGYRTIQLLALAGVFAFFVAASTTLSFMSGVIVCQNSLLLSFPKGSAPFACFNLSGVVAIAFAILKAIATINLDVAGGMSASAKGMRCSAWIVAVLFEITIFVTALTLTPFIAHWRPTAVGGVVAVWICFVLASGLLPALLFKECFQHSALPYSSCSAVDLNEPRFDSVEDLLTYVASNRNQKINDITVDRDGWIRVSQRTLAKLTGLPLSAVHRAVKDLHSSGKVKMDTSERVSRFKSNVATSFQNVAREQPATKHCNQESAEKKTSKPLKKRKKHFRTFLFWRRKSGRDA